MVRRAKNCIFWGGGFWGGGIGFERFWEKVMLVDVGVDGVDEDGSEMACGFIYVVVCCRSS